MVLKASAGDGSIPVYHNGRMNIQIPASLGWKLGCPSLNRANIWTLHIGYSKIHENDSWPHDLFFPEGGTWVQGIHDPLLGSGRGLGRMSGIFDSNWQLFWGSSNKKHFRQPDTWGVRYCIINFFKQFQCASSQSCLAMAFPRCTSLGSRMHEFKPLEPQSFQVPSGRGLCKENLKPLTGL